MLISLQMQYRRTVLRRVNYALCPSCFCSLVGRTAVGLRGPSANVRLSRQRSSDELVITDAALRIYRRMRRLERQCTCTDEMKADVSADWCKACAESWRLNSRLCECFGLPAWMFAYQFPGEQMRRPDQAAIDRFHRLEAASQAKKPPGFRFKWQK